MIENAKLRGEKREQKEYKRKKKNKTRHKALTSVPGLMSVFTGLHSKTVATEGGVDGRSMRPASDSTARNALTSEALLNPLIPEPHGQKTCRVGIAGIHTASRPGFNQRGKIYLNSLLIF